MKEEERGQQGEGGRLRSRGEEVRMGVCGWVQGEGGG